MIVQYCRARKWEAVTTDECTRCWWGTDKAPRSRLRTLQFCKTCNLRSKVKKDLMFCELLQEELEAEECTECWKTQMNELAKEGEANRLIVGKPRTITHQECKDENIIE